MLPIFHQLGRITTTLTRSAASAGKQTGRSADSACEATTRCGADSAAAGALMLLVWWLTFLRVATLGWSVRRRAPWVFRLSHFAPDTMRRSAARCSAVGASLSCRGRRHRWFPLLRPDRIPAIAFLEVRRRAVASTTSIAPRRFGCLLHRPLQKLPRVCRACMVPPMLDKYLRSSGGPTARVHRSTLSNSAGR